MNLKEIKIHDFSKNVLFRNHLDYMLDCVSKMVTIKNLPEYVPERVVKLLLICDGYIGVFKQNDKIYFLNGSMGGEPDEYYQPTQFILANPKLKSKVYDIDVDCVIVRNDSMMMGFLPILKKWASLLADSDITLRIVDINSRIPTLISAGDSATKKSGDIFMQNLIDGKLSIMGGTNFDDALKTMPYSSQGNHYAPAIEYNEYLRASWYNDIGIQINGNMKREAINEAEIEAGSDALHPFVDDVIEQWEKGFDKVNKMFGLNIEVEFDSSWKANKKELESEIENLDARVQTEDGGDEVEDEHIEQDV